MAYYDIYRDQLASCYRGHALWLPDPAGLYDRVRVGDVGLVKQGHFLRMFNALLPRNDPAQAYGVPEGFVTLNMGPFQNIRTGNLQEGNYCSTTVTVDHALHRTSPDDPEEASFRCRTAYKGGAFLHLPFSGFCEDAIRTKAFATYIRKHCDSWLEFAILNDLDARLEDIILVTGCDMIASWAMAVYMNPLEPEITLRVHCFNECANFQWSLTTQPHHNEPNQNTMRTHCVFLRGFRAKRIFYFFKTLRAAAGPGPDYPDYDSGSSMKHVRQQPSLPKYRDPLIGILDFIAEQCPDQEIAIAHDDDLKTIKGVDVLTADAVESFLRQNKIPVRTEHGAALLAGEDEVIPEDQKLTFFAQANASGKSIPPVMHPVLMEDLLKFDIVYQTPEYGFGLPTEGLRRSAVHLPVLTLILQHKQGYSQKIEVQASDKGSGIGAIIEDVLKIVGAHFRLSSIHREQSRPPSRIGREPKRGSHHIDYLSGRYRLQIFPLHPLLVEHGITQPLPPNYTY